MESVNKAIIVGNIGKDPVVRNFANGKVVQFSVATSKKYRDVANAVRYSIGNIVKIISDIKTLQKLYMAIGGNVSRIVVTDEEVEAEIKLQDELKANDDSDEKKDVDDE